MSSVFYPQPYKCPSFPRTRVYVLYTQDVHSAVSLANVNQYYIYLSTIIIIIIIIIRYRIVGQV